MDLYQTLQGILKQINDSIEGVRYEKDDKELLKAILDNQARLGESILILGGLMKSILSDEVEVHIMSSKNDTKH
jgi:hypothetical protein